MTLIGSSSLDRQMAHTSASKVKGPGAPNSLWVWCVLWVDYVCVCVCVWFTLGQPPIPLLYDFLFNTSTSVSIFFVLPYFSCFGEGPGLLSIACVCCVFCVLLKCHVGRNRRESWLATIVIQFLLFFLFVFFLQYLYFCIIRCCV